MNDSTNIQNTPLGNKSGLVAIVGRPSVGKSTFLNTASGEKISIVSPVPQTTRNAVKGIVNTSLGQLVFIDTPGYHNSEKKLNLKLKNITTEQLNTADAILYLIDATRKSGEEENMTAELVMPFSHKTIVAINKIDLKEANVTSVRIFISKALPQITANHVFEISAQTDKGIDEVLRALYSLVPEGEPFYPEEF
ncbi:MAG: GTPase Era, partial [Treponema sp.]|nr:GTPase Era [Treponema sp.]